MIVAATAEAAAIHPQGLVEEGVVAQQVMQAVEARVAALWEAAMEAADDSRRLVPVAVVEAAMRAILVGTAAAGPVAVVSEVLAR